MSRPSRIEAQRGLSMEPPSIEELLRRARVAIEPPEGASDRVLSAIEARVPAPRPRSSGRLVALSVSAGLTLAGAVGAYVAHGPRPSVAVAPHAVALPSRLPLPILPESRIEPAPVAPVSPPLRIVEPTPRAIASAPPSPPSPPKPSDEIALLVEAKSLLARRDASASLARLDEHTKKYPSTALAQERTRLRIEALCVSGKTEDAKRDFAQMVAEAPASPHLRSLRRVCPALDGAAP